MPADNHSLSVRDLNRLREIGAVLARHGFGRMLLRTRMGSFVPKEMDEEVGDLHWTVRVRKALVDLGPTFVKLGQILSVRPDVVPVRLARELQVLLDRVDPVDTAQVVAIIEEDLQSPIAQLFQIFDPQPLASASLAQVHRAVLNDGTEVALKVQRPGIERVIRSDVRILYTLARLLEDEVSLPGMHSLPEVIAEFETALYQELDFLAEARACERFRASLAKSHPQVFVPRTYPRSSSRRVLALELCKGKPATTLTPQDERAPAFARALIDCMFTQVFENGFFHGDPHPGNLLVTPDHCLAFLDFGLTGTLTAENQQSLSDILTNLVFRNAEGLALAVYHAGGTRGRVDLKAFRGEVAVLMEKYNGASLSDFAERENLLEIIEVAARHRIQLPKEFAVLGRATALVYGLAQKLLPDIDIMEEIRPLAQRLVTQQLNPQRVAGEAGRLLLQAQAGLSRLPLQANQLLADLEAGRLQINTVNPDAAELQLVVRRTGTRLALALQAAALTIAGALMVAPLDVKLLGIPMVPLAGIITIAAATLLWASLVAHTHLANRLNPKGLLGRVLKFVLFRHR